MDNFRRIESKYLLDENKYQKLMRDIGPHIKEDKYFKSTIMSIYYDNDNYDLINNSLDKPIFKEKVRLRSYGIPKEDDTIYLEIKKKYKGIVFKRRIPLKLKDINNIAKLNNNKEIAYVINKYHLEPKIMVCYDRECYVLKEDNDIRLTFDNNLRSRREDLKLELGDAGKKLYKDNNYILEIKSLNSLPLWLVHVLNNNKIYPSSYSKVGNILMKEGI